MTLADYRFDRFHLDLRDRRLRRDGVPVEINGRYLDALALLVREGGRLVSKDRFLQEVWRGVPVTDEALTQCIRTLRRQLGDSAAVPRFIETVPKHGYRFIAPVESAGLDPAVDRDFGRMALGAGEPESRRLVQLGVAGTVGAGFAGILGGLLYGFAGASQPLEPGVGAASVLLVLLCIAFVLALVGGAGVAFGIAALKGRGRTGAWAICGGALGGLIVGALVKLLGLDAFNLLLGRPPGEITGAAEGALLGAAVGLASWIAGRLSSLRRGVAVAALAGAAAGTLIVLAGGHLLAGSLHSLAGSFPGSRLRMDQLGLLVGEPGFGPVSQTLSAALEGALFAGCVVGAMEWARRTFVQRSTRAAAADGAVPEPLHPGSAAS